MIIGIGMDLIETSRVRDSIARFGDKFVERVFTPAEQEYCRGKKDPAPHYAARFTAKEACAKALGCGIANGVKWLDMEVARDAAGQPTMELSGHARELAASMAVERVLVTMTHAKDHAAAVVIMEG
jgi:holo-[acyl-carrier protein] synthase